MNIKKLCILRLSAIGDVCHAAAMVNRIQQHSPDIEITWVIGKIEYQLLKGMAGVRFVVFDKKQGKKAVQQLTDTLASEQFDALFVMQVALRANWVSRAINAKTRIGFDWKRSKELHWWFVNQRIAEQTHAHVLDGFMAFADRIGVASQQPPQWSMPMDADDLVFAQSLVDIHGQFAVISPAASKAQRNWLPERYAAAVDHLHHRGVRVILCGGPGPLDQQIGQQILQHTNNVADNLIGQTTLKQMLGVLSKAKLVIAPDTGPAHMATTVGTPVIGLYAHSNPRRTGPYNNLSDVVSVYDEVIEQQTGQHWSKLPWGKRAKGSDLMSKITTEAVIQKIDSVLT